MGRDQRCHKLRSPTPVSNIYSFPMFSSLGWQTQGTSYSCDWWLNHHPSVMRVHHLQYILESPNPEVEGTCLQDNSLFFPVKITEFSLSLPFNERENNNRKTHQKPPWLRASHGHPMGIPSRKIQVFQKNMTQKDDPVVTAWVPGSGDLVSENGG